MRTSLEISHPAKKFVHDLRTSFDAKLHSKKDQHHARDAIFPNFSTRSNKFIPGSNSVWELLPSNLNFY